MKKNCLFIVWLVLIGVSTQLANECKSKEGNCVSDVKEKKGCMRQLPYRCLRQGDICCEKERSVTELHRSIRDVGKKRIRNCKIGGRDCRRKGGFCVSQNKCFSETIDNACKKSGCTCCLRKNSKKKQISCKGSSACKKKGGTCQNIKSSCSGVVNRKLCPGKKCACCLPEGSGGATSSKCSCGKVNNVRIVGGKEVKPRNKYPWIVGLFSTEVVSFSFYCGGTIINDRFVLTAAHCLYNHGTLDRLKARFIKVSLADHNQYSDNDDVPGVTEYVRVRKTIPHEKYRGSSTYFEHDLGLVMLKTTIDFTKWELKPVCLPTDDSKTYARKQAIVAGWGTLDYDVGSPSDSLMEVTVPILKIKCPNNFPESLGIVITKNMLCAGRKKGGKDSCSGDSGGPLFLNEGSKYVLVGIVSNGFGCANPEQPGIYTRVSKYLNWINEKSKSGRSCP